MSPSDPLIVEPGLARRRLFPPLLAHVDRLIAGGDSPAGRHREAAGALAAWIAERCATGQPAEVVIVCTGNSRRSMLGALMGSAAAAYHGLPGIRFHSGGTEPSAFNPRTIASLRAIGFEVEPTGEGGTWNPTYLVQWGEGLAAREFSKRYDDPANPRDGFAAVMVCDEADAGCPVVAGAALRISMPFDDPKASDGTPGESTAYAERRDEIARVMLEVMMQVRSRLSEARAEE